MRNSQNKTAAYLRLSRDDGDKQESDSIRNQRELIKEYISNHKDLTPGKREGLLRCEDYAPADGKRRAHRCGD